MALKGKYEHAHWAVKVIQWLGCMFLLSIVAGISIFFFEQPLSTEALKWIMVVQQADHEHPSRTCSCCPLQTERQFLL